MRSRLAEAQSNWQLAQAAVDAAEQECTQLLQQVSQELNRASLVEQVCRVTVTHPAAFCSQCCHLVHVVSSMTNQR
jgi:hypothetical protein